MTTRRHLCLSSLAILAFTTVPTVAQMRAITLDELRDAFESRPRDAGIMIQRSLQGTGFYDGAIDGLWGPDMERAYEKLMASDRYRRHAPGWTWPHEIKVLETLFFTTSDAYP